MVDDRPAVVAAELDGTAFRLLVQGVLDYGIFMLDPGGHIASWNAGARRIKGYSAEEIVGRHFSVFYPPEDIAAGKPDWELEVAVADGRLEDEGWRLRKDGSRFWANVVITALYDDAGRLTGFGKVTRDLTERRREQQELAENRRLMLHLVQAQEAERRRIAWDVHDDSIQAMVAVGMRLQLLAGRLDGEDATVVHQLDEAVHSAISRLRNLIFRLRPPAIDEYGLARVLAGYLDDVVGSWDVPHLLRYELDREPPIETAITIFRICQEALTNVHKHARASTVDVSVTNSNAGILVRVVDDGVGLTDLGGQPAGHFGVVEMRERAETAGGWLTVDGRPGAGTTVEFWLPAPGPRP
jgi:PAS domain S-box-containing protein